MTAGFSLFLTAALLSLTSAQLTCTGVISSPPLITTDVFVPNGETCTLNGVNVTGSVNVGTNGGISTAGNVRIFGTVQAVSCGSLFLSGKLAVSGGVTVRNCKMVNIGPNANVGQLISSNVDTVVLQGTVALLNIGGNTNLDVNGGKVLGGGITRQNAFGTTTICGATVLGGIKLQNVTGNVNALASATCPKSDISGTIELSGTKGSVAIGGGMLLGADFIATIHDGPIELSNTHLSDIAIADVTGGLTIKNLQVDSDATIRMVQKDIMVTGSAFDGDFTLTRNPSAVNIVANDFTLEDILIGNNAMVSIRNNANFSFAANENGAIEVLNNKAITTASINKNGVTTISGNSFVSLSCADNNPQPTGTQNSVLFGTGQCANL